MDDKPITLGPIVVLRGLKDTGKTAIRRALRGALSRLLEPDGSPRPVERSYLLCGDASAHIQPCLCAYDGSLVPTIGYVNQGPWTCDQCSKAQDGCDQDWYRVQRFKGGGSISSGVQVQWRVAQWCAACYHAREERLAEALEE